MADEDLRRGMRVMLSGGIYGVDDESLNQLSGVIEDARRQRGFAPTSDADYLLKYSEICENFIMSRRSYRASMDSLNALNEEFAGRIGDSVKKQEIPAPWGARGIDPDDYEDDPEYYDSLDEYERDGWMPSAVC